MNAKRTSRSVETATAAALFIMVGGAGASAQPDYRYAIFELPSIGGTASYARGMNDLGDVVGTSYLFNGRLRATIWTAEGDITDLGTLGGSDSLGEDINDLREATGYSYREGGGGFRYNAFLWRDGEMIDLGTLTGDWAEGYALNSSSQVVGFATLVPGEGVPYHGFIFDDGMMVDLLALEPQYSSRAYGLNDKGIAVGWSQNPRFPADRHAVMWQDGKIIDLGTLQGTLGKSEARDINELGHVVGFGYTNGKERAFLWFDGRMYDLGLFSGVNETLAYGINNLSQVVGSGFPSGQNQPPRGFIWELGRGMQPLSDLIPPSRPAWRVQNGWDINDAGQIAADAYRSGNFWDTRAVLLSPVHPTMNMAAPAPGRAGQANTLAVTDATPGAEVLFLYSRSGGGERIPGCDLQQNTLQLDSPTVIGTAIADGNGVATITRTVPPIARGQTILFQAVVQNECTISQLVVFRFE